VLSRKLEYQRLSKFEITPEMKANIDTIQTEIVQVSLCEEDMDIVVANLNVYNQIMTELSCRLKTRPLNEFSGELAVLTARTNVRSLMWRALSQLKLKLNAQSLVLGCPYKPLRLEHVKWREYKMEEAKVCFDNRRTFGHRMFGGMEEDGNSFINHENDMITFSTKRDRDEEREEEHSFLPTNKKVRF
jgi:hypothetical protein